MFYFYLWTAGVVKLAAELQCSLGHLHREGIHAGRQQLGWEFIKEKKKTRKKENKNSYKKTRVFLHEFFFAWTLSCTSACFCVYVDACVFSFMRVFFFSFINSQPSSPRSDGAKDPKRWWHPKDNVSHWVSQADCQRASEGKDGLWWCYVSKKEAIDLTFLPEKEGKTCKRIACCRCIFFT